MKAFVVPSALLALCLPMLSVAAPAREKEAPVSSVDLILQRMDRDNDGQLSFEEYRNAVTRRFHKLDADGDGFLVQKEVPKEWLAVGAADLADGKVSAEEFGAGLQPAFDSFDLDNDNRLNNQELASFAQARAAKLEAAP